jgi:hypothetical protein
VKTPRLQRAHLPLTSSIVGVDMGGDADEVRDDVRDYVVEHGRTENR